MIFKNLRPKMLLRGASKHIPYNYLFYIKDIEGTIVTFDKYMYYFLGEGQFLVDFAMRRNESQWKNSKMIFNAMSWLKSRI